MSDNNLEVKLKTSEQYNYIWTIKNIPSKMLLKGLEITHNLNKTFKVTIF